MQTARDFLTPDALSMLQTIAEAGSFAAAARDMGMVPSALTYRVRQIEDALDVLLYDRSSRQAKLTAAGAELLREGARLLEEIDAVANRVKRVATGWEPQLTIAIDTVISKPVMMEMCDNFFSHAFLEFIINERIVDAKTAKDTKCLEKFLIGFVEWLIV